MTTSILSLALSFLTLFSAYAMNLQKEAAAVSSSAAAASSGSSVTAQAQTVDYFKEKKLVSFLKKSRLIKNGNRPGFLNEEQLSEVAKALSHFNFVELHKKDALEAYSLLINVCWWAGKGFSLSIDINKLKRFLSDPKQNFKILFPLIIDVDEHTPPATSIPGLFELTFPREMAYFFPFLKPMIDSSFNEAGQVKLHDTFTRSEAYLFTLLMAVIYFDAQMNNLTYGEVNTDNNETLIDSLQKLIAKYSQDIELNHLLELALQWDIRVIIHAIVSFVDESRFSREYEGLVEDLARFIPYKYLPILAANEKNRLFLLQVVGKKVAVVNEDAVQWKGRGMNSEETEQASKIAFGEFIDTYVEGLGKQLNSCLLATHIDHLKSYKIFKEKLLAKYTFPVCKKVADLRDMPEGRYQLLGAAAFVHPQNLCILNSARDFELISLTNRASLYQPQSTFMWKGETPSDDVYGINSSLAAVLNKGKLVFFNPTGPKSMPAIDNEGPVKLCSLGSDQKRKLTHILTFSEKSKKLQLFDEKGTTRLLDANEQRLEYTALVVGKDYVCATCTKDKEQILRMWDLDTFKLLEYRLNPSQRGKVIKLLQYDYETTAAVVAIFENGDIALYALHGNAELLKAPHKGATVTACTYLNDEWSQDHLALGYSDGQVVILDCRRGGTVVSRFLSSGKPLSFHVHNGCVLSIIYEHGLIEKWLIKELAPVKTLVEVLRTREF